MIILENITRNLPELLVLLFIAIVFLQSGLDKIFDWKGNLGWLRGHFDKTFLKNVVPMMLGTVLITEVLSGVLAIAGIYSMIITSDKSIALYASLLAAINLLMLLFGQRIAKDYAGAFTLTGYFLVVLFGIFLLTS